MLNVYTSNSSSSSRKAIKWLKEHQIPFHEIKMMPDVLTTYELKKIFEFTQMGLDELLKRNLDVSKFDHMTLHELFVFLAHDPSPLKRPILFDGKILKIGYNANDIRCFIPKDVRKEARKISNYYQL